MLGVGKYKKIVSSHTGNNNTHIKRDGHRQYFRIGETANEKDASSSCIFIDLHNDDFEHLISIKEGTINKDNKINMYITISYSPDDRSELLENSNIDMKPKVDHVTNTKRVERKAAEAMPDINDD